MIRRVKPLVASAMLLMASFASANESDGGEGENETASTSVDQKCGIWLAPSVLEGAGLGMYAGRSFKKGEPLQETGDIVIPIVDLIEHNDGEEFEFLWDEYTWSAEGLGLDHEGLFDINGASPGFGATANSFLPLVNVDEGNPENDNAGLHRFRDPGVGAFSMYHNRQSIAEQDIAPYQELFVSYGESWFKHRPFLGPIPLSNDLNRATNLFKKFLDTKSLLQEKEGIMDEVWDVFIRNSSFNESRVFGAFHHDKEDELHQLQQTMSLKKLRKDQSIRSFEWLKKHGTCGDHIRAGRSTIQQAGRGAFATRDLPKGTIVAQLPLIHVPNRSRFDMHELGISMRKGKEFPKMNLPVYTQQLLVNYCYGNKKSSLLLCPYGPIVNFVNHNQTRANVRLQWGDPARGNHMPRLLQDSIEAFQADKTAKFAFELIALRDIAKDEEIFLDYGDEWEAAWQSHVENWVPSESDEQYQSGVQLSASEDRLRTEFEIMTDPSVYPTNVKLHCNSYFIRHGRDWRNLERDGKLQKELDKDQSFYPCEILRFKEENGVTLYTTVVFDEEEEKHVLLPGIPRQGFKFLDEAYTSDMFQKKAFRHDIRIPDSMFPHAWQNLQSTE